MQSVFILLALFVVAPTNDPALAKRSNPKTAIKSLLEEASALYKTHIKAYQTAKTSAEQSNAIDSAIVAFEAWSGVIDDLEVSFEARVIDVTKDKASDTYYAIFEQPKDLQKFAGNAMAPTVAARKFHIEVTPEQSKQIKIGNRLTITGRLSTTLLYSLDTDGNARGTKANASKLDQPPPAVVCLFLFNYSPDVFRIQSTEYFLRPKNFVTVTLEDAEIQFPDKKP